MPLISPGISVQITDESFFIPAAATTVPLFFIATAENKLQQNAANAVGTQEYGVVRTVTSLTQSLALYGVPKFYEDTQGRPHHGDARNEYGLLALNSYLGLGNLAYVVRANVNLNDNLADIRAAWVSEMTTAALTLEGLITSFIDEYNVSNGYIQSNVNFKTNVTASELISLAQQVTADVWTKFTFRNLKADFFDDNTVPAASTAGYQVANFGGTASGATLLGLANGTYTASISVDGTAHPVSFVVTGGESFNTLVAALQAAVGATATVAIVSGNIKVTSATLSAASSVLITDATLFSSLVSVGFASMNVAIAGTSADALMPVFANGYTVAKTDDFYGFIGMVNDCVTQLFCPTVANKFTPAEGRDVLEAAADLFQFTVEFLNLTSLGANDAARRVAIVTALQAAVTSNTDVRTDAIEFNLILCPGYPEVADELNTLSIDSKEEAMVIADIPMNLNPDDVVTWADTNTQRQHGSNITYYYPHPLMTNIDGKTVLGSSSGTALRTMTYSDNVSEVWFAPAGTQRGRVTDAVAMGYVTGTLGTPTNFAEASLTQGQKDNLYKYFTNLNPITFLPGRGILVMGQKTSAGVASARDRINVERMLMYVRRQLRKNTLAFLFQPNDAITRANLKAMVDGFLNDILTKRGLYDYATLCDESNNTPDRIDRNELYIDIALKPVKAVEFLYIPIRVVATGASI